MSKQLIVVVHGVGVKQAGVSSDILSAAIEDPPEAVRDMSRKIAAAGKLRPHSSDDFHLREYEIHNSGGKRRIFPARIRRFRQYDKQHKISRERVIADFYWGDITTFTTGIIGLFMAIIRTILGISHAIRENARNAFPGNGKRNRSIRAAASLAALTIHGPIAAINIVLLGGVLLAWALQWMTGVSGGGLASIYLCGAISIGGGLWLLRTASPYLSRFLGEWIIIAGAVVLVFAIAASFDGRDPFSGLDYRFMWSSCHWDDAEAVKTASCIAAYEGIYLIGLRLLQLMNICWLIVLSAGAFIWLGQLTDTRKKSDKSPNLVLPSISAMMLAWILLIGCVWAAIARLGPGIIPHEYHLSSALNALLVVLAFLAAIGVAAVFVIVGRAHWAGQSGNVDLAKVVNRTEANRLIVAQSFIFLLYVFFFGTLLLAIHQAFGALDTVLIAPLDEFRNWLRVHFGTALLIAGAIGVFIVSFARSQLAAGLGILIDVLTYLNDYSWNSVAAGTVQTRTPMEKLFGLQPCKSARELRHGYYLRQRIQDRLRVLLNQLITDEQPDDLVIVSHSQGTVVGLDVIDSDGVRLLKTSGTGSQLRLVTMGSPYTHIHNHYFPASFPPHGARKNLRPVGKGGILNDWLNIFRIDDFVGTFVDKDGKWPHEQPVPKNGHTYYWTDENVFPVLRKFIAFGDAETSKRLA